MAGDRWVIDGGYRNKIGDLVLARADTVVWLDLPVHVWLPRLVRRTVGRIRRDEPLWNDNRESWRSGFWGRDSLLGYACGCTSTGGAAIRGSSPPIRSSACGPGGGGPFRARRRRDLSSATQAAPRRLIQTGVSPT